MTFKNKTTFNGEWLNDRDNGKGTIVFTNGDIYSGDIKEVKLSGQGKMNYSNGDIYEGLYNYCKKYFRKHCFILTQNTIHR